MLRTQSPPKTCSVCSEHIAYEKQYSSLANEYYLSAICKNNHIQTFPIKKYEVCPVCFNPPVTSCNCEQSTKECDQHHRWMTCNKCKHVTISNMKHIVNCEKCIPLTQQKLCSLFKAIINI